MGTMNLNLTQKNLGLFLSTPRNILDVNGCFEGIFYASDGNVEWTLHLEKNMGSYGFAPPELAVVKISKYL